MKRLVAAIGIVLSVYLIINGISDFDNATNGIELFKALFWLMVGTFALYGFIDDFRNDKWPFIQ